MDNLILIRVAAALDRSLRRASLVDLREEAAHRFRLVFERDGRRSSVIVSLRPERPWIGRPAGKREKLAWVPRPFAVAAAKVLRRGVLESVTQVGFDRVVKLRFTDGQALVAELATHGANLVRLDAEGRTSGVARQPRSSRPRLVAGQPYRPPALPSGRLDPSRATAEQVDRHLARARAKGEELIDALRRRVFGIGRTGATLVFQESQASDRSAGAVLVERLGGLMEEALDPVVQAPEEPRQAAESGTWGPEQFLLLPWEPDRVPEGARLFRGSDAAGTAGLYHEADERFAAITGRLRGLRSILDRQRRRLEHARRKVSGNLASFENPERHRRWGDALLAGLTQARRVGDLALVPDPYDAEGRTTGVPAPAGLGLTAAAEAHFRRYRRAQRGLAAAKQRLEKIEARSRRLDALAAVGPDSRGIEVVRRLEEAMRSEGIPVALEPPSRAVAPPRLEGVRLFTSSDGLAILVGKGARQNERLTFKLASPEDFWFHAEARPGAHVVVRNPARQSRPPEETLREAAALAAYYSDARNEGTAEVHWTRRKYVRRARGTPRGTVRIKRFETIRVRPALPCGGEDAP